MRNIAYLIFAVLLLDSCCIRHRTFAQSDRFDTHRPNFPVIECIPCGDQRNVNENFITAEALGPAGGIALGLELGHNFDHFRIYGAGSFSYWWMRRPDATFTGEIGILPLNPNFMIRPDIGIGYSDWIIQGKYDGAVPLHPSMSKVLVDKGSYQMWHVYGGLRIMVPFSNIDLGLRMYKMETLNPKGHQAWYPGFICAFRF